MPNLKFSISCFTNARVIDQAAEVVGCQNPGIEDKMLEVLYPCISAFFASSLRNNSLDQLNDQWTTPGVCLSDASLP